MEFGGYLYNMQIKSLTIASATINFGIFVYFIIALIKLNALDMQGLLISAFGILIALIADIVEAL